MNKQQLVDAVGERLGDRKTAAAAVEAVLDTVSGTLADGGRVSLFGFGVFERVERRARTARNPATGGTVEVPASSVPRFRAGQALKDAVNGRSSRPAARRTAEAADPPDLRADGGPRTARSGSTAEGKASEGTSEGKDTAKAKGSKGTSEGKGAAKGKASKGKGKDEAKGKTKGKDEAKGKAKASKGKDGTAKGKRSAAG